MPVNAHQVPVFGSGSSLIGIHGQAKFLGEVLENLLAVGNFFEKSLFIAFLCGNFSKIRLFGQKFSKIAGFARYFFQIAR